MTGRRDSGPLGDVTGGSGVLARVAKEVARGKARDLRRRVTRPWRRGRPGPAAEAGRWLGLGLAVGAAVAGAAAALWAARRRRRRS